MNFILKYFKLIIFWHGIGNKDSSSDLFKEYLSKLLLETGSRGIRPVSFFLYLPYPKFHLRYYHNPTNFHSFVF